MKSLAFVSVLALAAAAPRVALAADFLEADNVACTASQMLECVEGKCKGTPADAAAKAEVLVVDFERKKGATRTGGTMKPAGDIADDKVEGGVRSFQFGPSKDAMVKITLAKDGTLTIFMGTMGKEELRAEATCVEE
jgi:hypothetical protein